MTTSSTSSVTSGTAYLLLPSPRSVIIKNLATYLKLDIKFSDRDDATYKKNFPLDKAPAYLDSEGWKLHETLAIIEYLAAQKPDDDYSFYGKSLKDHAKVTQWLSFANTDQIAANGNLFFRSHTDEEKAAARKGLEKIYDEYEEQLKVTKYLTGSTATLADAFGAIVFNILFIRGENPAWKKTHPALYAWWKDVATNDPVASISLKESAGLSL